MKNEEQARTLFGISLSERPRWKQFLICSSGFFFGYLVNGICEEYVYNRLQFSYGWYFTFVQGWVYIFLIYLQGFTPKQMVNPWKTYVKLSAVLMGSNGLTKGSLAFLNYPAQLMFKSTKVLPVMVMGAFIPGLKRKYPPHEYVSAVLLVVGLILFTLADAHTSPNFSVIGVLMVSGALIMDAFLGNLQEAIFTMNPATTQTEMLFCSTLVGMPFLIPPMLVTGELFKAWSSCSQHPYVYGVLVFEAMATFIGQVSVLSLIALFGAATTAMFGAYPVFVVDGTPSPLKSQARAVRFFRASGLDLSSFTVVEEGVSVKRNSRFVKYVEECVELLELLGMPVLKAKGEAEALCAQLNREGVVDACITADSDAFLFGAQCIIKRLQINSKEPFECYHISDIEAGLGLTRNHLIAISLLVGSDHDLSGVAGIGIDTALRFVKCFSEDEILNRLHEIGRGGALVIQGSIDSEVLRSSDENLPKTKSSHCSHCGHPGSKISHLKFSCEYCGSTAGQSCKQKFVGFKCDCLSCDLDKKEKERKKKENWQINVCRKISLEKNFPNDEIIQMYLSNHHGTDDDPCIEWASPKTEMLVDYLTYQQHWEPSYIRQRMLPMLSTIYLRDMASSPTNDLLYGHYEFHSIQRVKIRHGLHFYVVKWKKAVNALSDAMSAIPEEPDILQGSEEPDESNDLLEEPDVPVVFINDGCCFLSTDEDMELVRNAFPEKVDQFLKEKELKERKSRKKKSSLRSEGTPKNSESSTSQSLQLSITEFYRSSKVLCENTLEENDLGASEGKRKEPSTRLSKSARRRLLFD